MVKATIREFLDLISTRPVGGYDLIMADPPWRFENWSAAGEGKNPSQHYQCQPIDWIKSLPVEAIAAQDCLLWLWAINPMLPEALDVIKAWGFQFKTAGHWVKTTKNGKLAFGAGYILRGAGEPFLIATRGSPATTRSTRSVIMAPLREHSRKPDEAYEAAESLIPDAKRIDVFSREERPGWKSWGNEVDKFSKVPS